ncbi:MAG: copper chaperone PCu(A)C [Rhodanobacteraceae bacterium]|nr:copper chaperone PCu(A)C [Rhodanobacteraceae bacterium]
MLRHLLPLLVLAVSVLSGAAHAEGRLVIENAWIRAAPPAAPMRAGYATLRNVGDAPLLVRGARSDAFGDITLHATQMDDGIARMRELEEIKLAPGEQAVLEPGGKHLMLMRPLRELNLAETATIVFEIGGGTSTATADFIVREAAEADPTDHH